ncbi:MAG: hypothetical protein QF662_02720, partial [Phycisphaerae bacterium]|nr:hypothetical protein [Phycisphaerae bacterium]
VLAEGKKPRVEPETVEAVVTESDLDKSAGTSHFATVDVDLGGVELPEGGGPLTRDVPLHKYLDGNPKIPAVCLPSSVSVTLVVESHLMTKMLQDIPVVVSGPAEVMNNYEVVFHEPTKATLNLKVVGPRDAVGPLLPREVAIYLEITAEDKPAEDPGLLREPRIVLPPGVKLADPQAPKIAFNLKRRAEPAESTE